MNITVYLGANEGNDPKLKEAVRELGMWIGKSGNSLVYGGSKCGLMGELAESVLTAGGEATGRETANHNFVRIDVKFYGMSAQKLDCTLSVCKWRRVTIGRHTVINDRRVNAFTIEESGDWLTFVRGTMRVSAAGTDEHARKRFVIFGIGRRVKRHRVRSFGTYVEVRNSLFP